MQGHAAHEAKIICKTQQERGRYFWLEDQGQIKTNMIIGNQYINDKMKDKINMFIGALKNDGRFNGGAFMLTHPEEQNGHYWDDLSGVKLEPLGVQNARQEDMKEFEKHGVYQNVPIK